MEVGARLLKIDVPSASSGFHVGARSPFRLMAGAASRRLWRISQLDLPPCYYSELDIPTFNASVLSRREIL